MSSPRLSVSITMTFGVGAAAIGFDRRGDAAHLDLQMRLAQPAILAGGLHGGRGLDGLAEGLHGDARRRRDVLAVGCGSAWCWVGCVRHHCPTSLILPLAASG